jgi:hypothetical protein
METESQVKSAVKNFENNREGQASGKNQFSKEK